MKTKFFTISIFAVIFELCAFSLPKESLTYTPKVISCIINCDFEKAFKLSDSLSTVYPDDPLPLVLKLTALGMRDMDFEQMIDSVAFLETYDKTTKLVHEYEKNNGVSSYSKTLDGISKATYASFYIRIGSYFAALNSGLDGIKLLKEAKNMDKDNTEANLFLGLYDYSGAELRKKFWWGLFWYPGNKADGIQKLAECGKKAFITGTAAQISLSEIYVKEKQPEKAWTILENLHSKFPNSRFVLWGKAKYFESIEKFSDAALIYEKLALEYAKLPKGSYNYTQTSLFCAQNLAKSGMNEKATLVCENLLKEENVKNSRSLQRETKKILESVK